MIEKYFQKLEDTISFYFGFIKTYSLNKKIYNEYQGYITGKIEFNDGFLLDFTEVKNIDKANKVKYRYHFQFVDKLIFRYDNAPHFRDLPNSPHHKHLQDDTVISTEEVGLDNVLLEIVGFLRGRGI